MERDGKSTKVDKGDDTVDIVAEALVLKFGDEAIDVAIRQLADSSSTSFGQWAKIVNRIADEQPLDEGTA